VAESIKLADAIVMLAADNAQLKKDLASAEGETKSSTDRLSGLFKAVVGGAVVGMIVAGVGKIAGAIGGMVQDAAGVEVVRANFGRLASSIGATPTDALDGLRAATRGLVEDASLMQTANMYMAMGLATTNEEMQTQIETATQLGMAMGNSAEESAESWALMNANMSAARLDSFGISSGAVNARINELTTGVNALSREEAWNIAVNEQAAISLQRVGEQTGTASQRWAAATANLKDSVGRGFVGAFENALSGAASLVQKFTPLLQSVSGGLGAIANQGIEVLKRLVTVMAEKLGIDFGDMSKNAGTWGQNITIQLAKGIASAIGAVMTALNRLGGAIAGMLKPGSPPKLLPDIDKWGADAATVYMDGWGDADYSVFDLLTDKIGGYIKGLGEDVMPKEDVNPWLASLNAAIAETINSVNETGNVSLDVFDDILGQVDFLPASFQDYARSLLDAELAQLDLTSAMDTLEAATQAVSDAQDELNAITDEYSAKLAPLNKEMAALQAQKQAIKDKQRLAKLNATLIDGEATAEEKALARLEIEEIGLKQQMALVEEERDVAVDAQQAKIDALGEAEAAAKAEVDAKAEALTLAQEQIAASERLIGVQQEANGMINEQASLMAGLAATMEGVGASMGGMSTSMAGIGPSITESLEAVTGEGGIADVGDGLALGITDGLSGITDDIMAEFAPIEGNIQTLTDTWSGIFTSEGGTAKEKLAIIATETWDKIKGVVATKAVELITEISTKLFIKMATAYCMFFYNLDAALLMWWLGLMCDLGMWWLGLMRDLGIWWLGLVTDLTTWWDDLITEIEDWWDTFLSDMETWFSDLWDSISTWWEDLVADLTAWWAGLVISVVAWWEAFRLSLEGWLGGILVWIEEQWVVLTTAATTGWGNFRAAIEDVLEGIQTWITNIFTGPDGILTFLGNLDLAAIGAGIFDTLWTGLKTKWNEIAVWMNTKIAAAWAVLQAVWPNLGPAPQLPTVTITGGDTFDGANPFGAMGANPFGAMGGNPFGAMGGNPFGAMGGGGIEGTEILLIIEDSRTGSRQELPFRLGSQQQLLIDMGQTASAR